MPVPIPLTQKEELLLQSADLVGIGAGPVGLFMAIQAVLRARDKGESLKIVFIDKHTTYVREHPLKLNPNIFKREMHPATNIPGLSDQKSAFSIRTNDLEGLLLERATALGIRVIRSEAIAEHIKRRLDVPESARAAMRHGYLNELLQRAPHARALLGTDGAHSLVRKSLFGPRMKRDSMEKHVAQVKFKVRGKTASAMNAIQWAYPTAKILDFKALEHVGKFDPKTLTTTVSVRFFIDKHTFDALRQAKDADGNIRSTPKYPIKGKEVYALGEQSVLPIRLRRSIRTWLNAKKRQVKATTGEHLELQEDSIALTTIPIRHFQSKQCVKTMGEIDVVIEGDARKGSPYFTSLNYGLKTSAMAAAALAEPDPSKRAKALKAYEAKTNKSLHWLYFKVRCKSILLSLASWLIFISAYTPWQLNRWSSKQTRQLLAEDPMAVPPRNMRTAKSLRKRISCKPDTLYTPYAAAYAQNSLADRPSKGFKADLPPYKLRVC